LAAFSEASKLFKNEVMKGKAEISAMGKSISKRELSKKEKALRGK